MGYLRDHPDFHHLILAERDDAVWLLPGDDGWTLPAFTTDEQHTAEVELVARHIHARYGTRVSILGAIESELDEAANRVRRVYLAEALTAIVAEGRFWPRAAIAAGDVGLAGEARDLLPRWARNDLVAGDTAWSRPGWLAEALAWAATHTGPIVEAEQVRVSEFSTVIRVGTRGGVRYLKAVAPAAAREPAVTAALARRTSCVPAVLAVDAPRRLLLMEGFDGEPLASGDIAVWAAVARTLGEMQRDGIAAVPELRALGCEVATATTLARPLAALLADADALLVGRPAGLTADEVAALRELAPGLAAEARALDAGSIPPTIDHGDLWPSNVLVGPGGCAFVDWEDVRVAHPFVSLFQLFAGAHLDRRFDDEAAAYASVRDAYLDAWSGWGPRARLRHAFDVAHDVAAVAVAASYRRYPAAVVAAHPWMREMPAFCLRRIIARRAWT